MATELERSRFRNAVGDTGTPPAFGDAEVDDLFDQANELGYSSSPFQRLYAQVLAIRILLVHSSKRTTYVQNASTENLSDVFKNLRNLLDEFKGQLESAQGAVGGPAVRWGAPRDKPRRVKEWPDA